MTWFPFTSRNVFLVVLLIDCNWLFLLIRRLWLDNKISIFIYFSILIFNACVFILFYFILLPFNVVWGNQLLMISEQELVRIYAAIMFATYFYRTWLYTYILITRRGSYKKKELLTLCEHSSSLPVFCVIHVAHILSFLCCAVPWFVCLFVCFILFVFCFCFVLFLFSPFVY